MRYRGAINFRLNPEGIKGKLYLCKVRVNPSIYRELMDNMDSGKSGELSHSEKQDQGPQHPAGHQTGQPFPDSPTQHGGGGAGELHGFQWRRHSISFLPQAFQSDQHQTNGGRRNLPMCPWN